VGQESLSSAFYLVNSADLVTGAQVVNEQVLLAFGRAQIARMGHWFATAPKLVTGATYTETQACSGGGSLTATITDVNGNNDMDVGDSATVVATNCVEAALSMNGTVTIGVTALSGDLNTDRYSATLTLTFTNLAASSAAGSVIGNGNITVALASTGLNATTLSLTVDSFCGVGPVRRRDRHAHDEQFRGHGDPHPGGPGLLELDGGQRHDRQLGAGIQVGHAGDDRALRALERRPLSLQRARHGQGPGRQPGADHGAEQDQRADRARLPMAMASTRRP